MLGVYIVLVLFQELSVLFWVLNVCDLLLEIVVVVIVLFVSVKVLVWEFEIVVDLLVVVVGELMVMLVLRMSRILSMNVFDCFFMVYCFLFYVFGYIGYCGGVGCVLDGESCWGLCVFVGIS